MSIDRIILLDTETTGMDPKEGAALLEVAWVPLVRDPEIPSLWYFGEEGTYGDAMIRYDGVIPPEARAVHHISPAMVAEGSGALDRDLVVHSLAAAEEPGNQAYAAHNAAFDRQFLPELGQSFQDQPAVPWLCTWRAAMHLWPDAPGYSNQVLRYWLGVEPPEWMLAGLAPHRALYDTAVTAAILQKMLETHTPEQLVTLCGQPVLQKKIRFGQHAGKLWAEVPKDYIGWMLRKGGFDADVMHTARHWADRI